MQSRARTLLVVALVVGMAFAPATAAALDPRFETNAPEPTLTPGATQQLTVQITNDAQGLGDEVETATRANLTLESTDGFDVKTGKQFAGNFPDGERRSFSFRLHVAANVDSGAHEIPLRIGYTNQGEWRTTKVPVEVRVEDRPRFRVESVESDTQVGTSGPVSVTVNNTGNEAVTDSTVSLRSDAPSVTFGNAGSATRFVGAWAPGEERTVTFDASVASGAEVREYALAATVGYDDSNDESGQSRALSLGVTPDAEQNFSVSELGGDVRVGSEGDVAAAFTNTGPDRVRNLVVNLRTDNPNINPLETEFAVGSLAAGESVDVSFPVEVSDAAAGGPRQLDFVAAYETGTDDATQRSEPIAANVEVAPARDVFGVEPVNGTLAAGSSAQLELSVTNNAEHALRDINAKAFVDSPLSTSDDEAFIAELGPGETREIVFSVSASGSAIEKDYPLSADFQYTEPDGDTKLSDTYQLPVSVTTAESGGGPPVVPIVVVLVLALVGGGLWYRRRGDE
jgi:hypothetical protein